MARRSSHYAASFHCVLERRASSWICWASRPRESWFSLNAGSGRNPEARREIIAQLFEYASLLAEWSYSDLEAKLKQSRGLSGENPMFHAVRAVYPHLLDAPFVDAVSESLRTGNFCSQLLATAYAATLHSLRRLLENRGGLLASLALLEIQLYRDSAGRTLLVPSSPI